MEREQQESLAINLHPDRPTSQTSVLLWAAPICHHMNAPCAFPTGAPSSPRPVAVAWGGWVGNATLLWRGGIAPHLASP